MNITKNNENTEQKEKQLEILLPVNHRDYFAIRFAQAQIELIKDEQFDALETFKTSYKLADIMMKAREVKWNSRL